MKPIFSKKRILSALFILALLSGSVLLCACSSAGYPGAERIFSSSDTSVTSSSRMTGSTAQTTSDATVLHTTSTTRTETTATSATPAETTATTTAGQTTNSAEMTPPEPSGSTSEAESTTSKPQETTSATESHDKTVSMVFTETEEIPYETETRYSDSYYDDEVILLREGIPGIKVYTTTRLYREGREVGSFVSEHIETYPQDEIVIIGTKISYTSYFETRRSDLPYTTERIEDNTLPYGEENVITQGKKGTLTEVYEIIYYRGAKQEEILLSADRTEPVNEVIAVGTYVAPEPEPEPEPEPAPEPEPEPEPEPIPESFRMPYLCAGENIGKYTGRNYGITQYYASGGHGGIDIGVWYGEAVVASKSGRVVMAYNNGAFDPATDKSMLWTYGTFVVIEHADGMRTYYAHMSKKFVSVGDVVYAGEVIGESGNTGRVSPSPTASNPYAGTHLHFEIRVYDSKTGKYTRVNPMNYLP